MLEISCLVETGARELNDDRAAINKKLVSHGAYSETAETTCLAAVCDGVGGVDYGNEAAQIVTGIFSSLSGTRLTENIINEYIKKANNAVLSAQKADIKHSKMATTIAGLYIKGDDFIAFNAGDSRIYRYRAPYIMQLSTDHSVYQEQIDMGLEPKPGQENIITRYIGGACANAAIVDGTGKVFAGDIFVLCSDGVWGSLEFEDFENILKQENNLEEACKVLVNLALNKGSKDNLSVIIIRRS